MKNLYFECANGISGDMAVAALIDLGADITKLQKALDSMNLQNEFTYEIKEVKVNSIKASDFNVIYDKKREHHYEHNGSHVQHHHEHRNLNDVIKIIDNCDAEEKAKALAKKIFTIVAQAESDVHGKNIDEVHFHEVGAVDSIADIVSFSVLFEDLSPDKVYFNTLTEGQGSIKCAHGVMNVPVPAVCAITSKYKLPIKITNIEGEMITPTGAAIAAALYTGEKLPETIIIKKVGNGAGKRPYPNPVLRVISFETVANN